MDPARFQLMASTDRKSTAREYFRLRIIIDVDAIKILTSLEVTFLQQLRNRNKLTRIGCTEDFLKTI